VVDVDLDRHGPVNLRPPGPASQPPAIVTGMGTNVYVDAFNLYYGALRGTQRQPTYLRALETVPHLSIHLGRYLSHLERMPLARPAHGQPSTVEVIKTEEKGSDVNIATYLFLDGFRRDYDTAVVITNDSDLTAPVALAQTELGLTVGVVNPHHAKRRSRALRPTFFKQLRPSVLGACQFPSVMRDSRGAFRKPASW
jgi:hypothetical protein